LRIGDCGLRIEEPVAAGVSGSSPLPATTPSAGIPSVNPRSPVPNPQFHCVFWSSKLAIDADGKAEDAQHLSGVQLDPADGQDDTSFHFPDGSALSSERHPYVVLPGGEFRALTGLRLGDVAAIIYRNRITAAICGDIGPMHKIGEASIRVHEAFIPDAPDPCRRNPDGSCRIIHDVSIDQDVLIFAFPNSALGAQLNPDNAEALVKARAYALFAQLQTLAAI
jgi:Fungal chitosanase of glycosyl hydrolase group 75